MIVFFSWIESNVDGDEDPSGREAVLAELIPLIRFPLMNSEQFNGGVVPTNVLTEPQVFRMHRFFTE
jgi:hypothetical protein